MRDDRVDPATFLIPTSFARLEERAVERFMKFTQAISKMNSGNDGENIYVCNTAVRFKFIGFIRIQMDVRKGHHRINKMTAAFFQIAGTHMQELIQLFYKIFADNSINRSLQGGPGNTRLYQNECWVIVAQPVPLVLMPGIMHGSYETKMKMRLGRKVFDDAGYFTAY